jgi:hypothetical protein
MSIWSVKQSSDSGRRVEITTIPYIELVLFGSMFGIPLALILAGPIAFGPPRTAAVVLFGLLGGGLSLFLIAKLSVVRQGSLFSFGSRQMSTSMRRCYRLGYALCALGAALSLTTLMWWSAG